MDAAPQMIRKSNPTVLSASSRFGPFKPESEQNVRVAKVETNPALARMKEVWKESASAIELLSDMYSKPLGMMKNQEFSSKDIESVSIALAEFQGGTNFPAKAGFFLSALMEACKDDEFVIHTAHFAEPIVYLGYLNKKKITITGAAGHSVGSEMENGSIIVEGDAGSSVGFGLAGGIITIHGNASHGLGQYMKGGVILVDGNAGAGIGGIMKGGTITVEGNAGNDIGEAMDGGVIRINGTMGWVSQAGRYQGLSYDPHGRSIPKRSKGVIHGKIYNKEKLIVDK